MTAVPYLRIDELVVGYGDLAVLRGVDLRLGRGQIGAVLGASGGGKSTLLRAIAGFLRPRAGSIYLGGRLLSSRDRLVAPERRNLGLVYQDYALFPHLTVAQNVGFGLGGKKADERAAICARMLELVRMAGEAGRYPAELSGGQQQRVALARALAAGPDLLLLDEPFSSLDLTLRRELAADLGEILRARGTTALLVTHDQLEACALAERVGVLGDGRLRQWGSAQDLYRCPADPLVAAALGRGSLLEGRVADDGRIATELGAVRAHNGGRLNGGAMRVLVRPEEVRFAADGAVAGRIERKQFMGAGVLYRLRLPSGVAVEALVPAGGAGAEIGASVGLRLAVEEAVVFGGERGDVR